MTNALLKNADPIQVYGSNGEFEINPQTGAIITSGDDMPEEYAHLIGATADDDEDGNEVAFISYAISPEDGAADVEYTIKPWIEKV